MHVMLINNYSHPFVATVTSNTTKGNLGQEHLVGTKRNMSIGQKTPGPLPTWLAKVSHMSPGEWLGNLHSEKQVQDPGEGVLWLLW